MNPNEQLYSNLGKLKRKQRQLGLTSSDTGLQEPGSLEPQPQPEDLEFYAQMFQEMALQQYPLRSQDRQELAFFQRSLHLSDEDAIALQQHIAMRLGLPLADDDLPNEPVLPQPVKFTAAPPGASSSSPSLPPLGATVPPQEFPQDILGEGSTTPTVQSKPPSSHSNPAKDAVIQRLGSLEQPAQPGNQDLPGQAASVPVTQAPAEAGRSPDPAIAAPTATPTTATPTTAAPPETLVQPPVTQTAAQVPAAAAAEQGSVEVAGAEAPAKTKWWLDKRFLILFFGLLAALTGLAVMFATSRQFLQSPGPDPQAAQQLLQSGTQNLQRGEFEAALKAFDEAIRLNSEDFNAYINRGYARHQLRDLDGAASDYSRAIELNQNSAEAFNNRSHVRVDQRRYDEAIKDATRALELNPNLPEANVNLGNALFAQRDLDRAAQQFQAALQSNASSTTKARAHNNRGNIFLANDQVQQAGTEYDSAIQLDPRYADAFFNRGIANERNQNYPAAARDFAEAAKLYETQNNRDRSREAQTRADRMRQQNPSTPPPPATPNQQSV